MTQHSEQLELELDASQLRSSLKRWYVKHARLLPWRETANPYHIWISEIMLQQTTVKAVVPYFERFLKRFPSVSALSQAREEEVLQYWEGLGYYSRGRNILKAARVIQEQYQGQFPSDLHKLTSLPGIGRYTAGAIRSFGFNKPAPIVEANTLRLYCRLMGYEGDPRSSAGQNSLWSFAEAIQPARSAGTLNQSLMELGSLICTPNEPDCPSCPLRTQCRACADGTQAELPRPKPRPVITPVVEATVAVRNGRKFLIRQRSEKERWAGLWDFPRFELIGIDPEIRLHTTNLARLTALVLRETKDISRLNLDPPEFHLQIRHSVTRYRIRLLCFLAELDAPNKSIPVNYRWASLKQIDALPMPVSGRKFANSLKKTL